MRSNYPLEAARVDTGSLHVYPPGVCNFWSNLLCAAAKGYVEGDDCLCSVVQVFCLVELCREV